MTYMCADVFPKGKPAPPAFFLEGKYFLPDRVSLKQNNEQLASSTRALMKSRALALL